MVNHPTSKRKTLLPSKNGRNDSHDTREEMSKPSRKVKLTYEETKARDAATRARRKEKDTRALTRLGKTRFHLGPRLVDDSLPERLIDPKKKDRAAAANVKAQIDGRPKDANGIGIGVDRQSLARGCLEGTLDPLTESDEESVPKPPRKHVRPNIKRKKAADDQGRVYPHFVKVIENQMTELFETAKVNTVMFQHFDFQAECKKRSTSVPPKDEWEVWDDDVPRIGVDRTGKRIAMHVPNAIKLSGRSQLQKAVEDLADKVPPGRTKNTVDKPSKINWEANGPKGEHTLVRGWHAIGQQGVDKFGPSATFIKDNVSFEAHATITDKLNPLATRVNVLLSLLDPVHYKDAERLKELLCEKFSGYRRLAESDVLVYDGREVLWNVESEVHTDSHDPTWGWAVMVFLGSYTGGDFYCPNLGVRMRAQPGDIIFIKGRVIRHGVMPFSGGPRISIPHFTHTSVWEMVEEIFISNDDHVAT